MKTWIVYYVVCDIIKCKNVNAKTADDAIKEARRWLSREEASYIYDQQKRIVRHAFRGSPELAFNARAITPACIMHI